MSTGVNGGRDLEDALHDDDNDPASPLPCRHDGVVPLANAEFLDQRLPASRMVIIDAGHFVWEEAPTEYASAVLDSITRAGSGPAARP